MSRRYHTLDSLRGVAAILVVMGHAEVWFAHVPTPNFRIAVDLFFVLSGFVLARVYEPRFAEGMTVSAFMGQRYARLYPLYALGAVIGILSGIAALALHHGNFTPVTFAVAAVTGLLLLPSPTPGSTAEIVPMNVPGWSLVFELVANFAYVLLWRLLSTAVLVAIVMISGIAFALFHLRTGLFGGEWPTIAWGLPRVTFSFFAGVLIARRRDPPTIHTHSGPLRLCWWWRCSCERLFSAPSTSG